MTFAFCTIVKLNWELLWNLDRGGWRHKIVLIQQNILLVTTSILSEMKCDNYEDDKPFETYFLDTLLLIESFNKTTEKECND